jgi:hypothetical protein
MKGRFLPGAGARETADPCLPTGRPQNVREKRAVRDDEVNNKSEARVSAVTVALVIDAALKAAALHLHLFEWR